MFSHFSEFQFANLNYISASEIHGNAFSIQFQTALQQTNKSLVHTAATV